MVEVVNTLRELLHPKFLVENVYLFGVLSIFLAVYGPRLHMRLPTGLRNMFHNPIFRSIVLFLIAYLSHRDFVASLVITVVFIVTMNLLHTIEVIDTVKEKFQSKEHFASSEPERPLSYSPGPPIANCNVYSKTKENSHPYYPIHAE
jgi:hypothetical protein